MGLVCMTENHVSILPLSQALRSLEDALDPPPRNDRERDGAIQRFEYTFELSWKTGKRVLEDLGITSLSPKSVFRDLGHQGYLSDVEKWLGFLQSRNKTSHIYKETVAQEVFATIAPFVKACHDLIAAFARHT